MSKIRINDLARELEVKSKAILDVLQEAGVTEKKTHSSSLDEHEAEKVRAHFRGTGESHPKPARSNRPEPDGIKTKIDLSHISKPGDVLKAIIGKQQTAASTPPTAPPTRPVPPAAKPVAPATVPKPPAPAPAPPASITPPRVVTPPAAAPKPVAPAASAPSVAAPPMATQAPPVSPAAQPPSIPAVQASIAQPAAPQAPAQRPPVAPQRPAALGPRMIVPQTGPRPVYKAPPPVGPRPGQPIANRPIANRPAPGRPVPGQPALVLLYVPESGARCIPQDKVARAHVRLVLVLVFLRLELPVPVLVQVARRAGPVSATFRAA